MALDFISFGFLINVLNFIIQEYSYFTLEGDMYYDQELADLAAKRKFILSFIIIIFLYNKVDLEEKEKTKMALR